MAIETAVAPRQKIRFVVVAVICLGLALWAAYDNAVTLPRRTEEARRFEQLRDEFQRLEAADKAGTMSSAERARWKEVETDLNAFGGAVPQPPAAWDWPVNMWLYIVGCGVLGVPWCLWALWSMSRRRWRLDEDGTLHAPEGAFAAGEIADIDMSRWMDKSIATVRAAGGRTTMLDDYKYRHSDRIVGRIAHRLFPADWTEEAKPVKRTEDGPEVGPDISTSAAGGA